MAAKEKSSFEIVAELRKKQVTAKENWVFHKEQAARYKSEYTAIGEEIGKTIDGDKDPGLFKPTVEKANEPAKPPEKAKPGTIVQVDGKTGLVEEVKQGPGAGETIPVKPEEKKVEEKPAETKPKNKGGRPKKKKDEAAQVEDTNFETKPKDPAGIKLPEGWREFNSHRLIGLTPTDWAKLTRVKFSTIGHVADAVDSGNWSDLEKATVERCKEGLQKFFQTGEVLAG